MGREETEAERSWVKERWGLREVMTCWGLRPREEDGRVGVSIAERRFGLEPWAVVAYI